MLTFFDHAKYYTILHIDNFNILVQKWALDRVDISPCPVIEMHLNWFLITRVYLSSTFYIGISSVED